MKFIRVSIQDSFPPYFRKLLKRWPQLNYGVSAEIGYQGRRALYTGYERGQVINLSVYPYDKRGHRTVSYRIAKNKKSILISSYPLNFYDPVSVYNSAAATVQNRVARALSVYDKKVLQARLDSIGRSL